MDLKLAFLGIGIDSWPIECYTMLTVFIAAILSIAHLWKCMLPPDPPTIIHILNEHAFYKHTFPKAHLL